MEAVILVLVVIGLVLVFNSWLVTLISAGLLALVLFISGKRNTGFIYFIILFIINTVGVLVLRDNFYNSAVLLFLFNPLLMLLMILKMEVSEGILADTRNKILSLSSENRDYSIGSIKLVICQLLVSVCYPLVIIIMRIFNLSIFDISLLFIPLEIILFIFTAIVYIKYYANYKSLKKKEIDNAESEKFWLDRKVLYTERLNELLSLSNSDNVSFEGTVLIDYNNKSLYNSSVKYLTLHEKWLEMKRVFGRFNITIDAIREEYATLNNLSKDLSSCEYKLLNVTNRDVLDYIERSVSAFNTQHEIIYAGLSGEAKVNESLAIHNNIVNLDGYTLIDSSGNSVECDNILVTEFGIFVLEVKNYGSSGSYSIQIDDTGNWYKVARAKDLMKNPVEQNSRHIAIVNNILMENNINISAKGIIVISNEEVNITNRSNQIVTRPGGIYSSIQGNTVLTREDIENIRDIICKYRIEDKKFQFTDYDLVFDNLNHYSTVIEKAIELLKEYYNIE